MPNRPIQPKLPISDEAVTRLREFFFEVLKPKEDEPVDEWVEKNVDIPTGAITGMASLKLTPYAREILNRMGSKTTRHIVMVFGTQAAKTSIMIWGMLYRLCRDAQDAMWVLPTGDLAKSFSKSRWQKYVRSCKSAIQQVPRTSKGDIDKSLFGFVEQHFFSMVLNFVGSNSPANLSSRPVGMLWMDETDKYGDEVKFEAAALKLAEERTKTYPFPLVVKSSTPTTEDRIIWQEFLKTDQNYYWVTCPRKGCQIRFKFTAKSEEHGDCGVRWWRETEEEVMKDGEWDMGKVKMNAFYKCQCCGGEIYDFERGPMLDVGKWIASNPNAEPGRHGYHLNSLYSILSEKTSLGSIAVEYLNSYRNRRDLQNFVNSWLAEPWDESRGFIQNDIITEDITDIPRGTISIMAVDVQQGHYWVLVRRFEAPTKEFLFGRSWLVYANKVQTEEELVDIQKEYQVKGENVTCDIARRPNQVARMIIEHDWRGILGTDTKEFEHPGPNSTKIKRAYSRVQYRDPYLGTAWENRRLERAIFVKFSKPAILDIVAAMRYQQPQIWHVTLNVHEKYQEHMNSRVKTQQINKRTGRAEWFWRELHQRNHLSDCENHVTVRALQLGLLSMPNESDAQNG